MSERTDGWMYCGLQKRVSSYAGCSSCTVPIPKRAGVVRRYGYAANREAYGTVAEEFARMR